MSSIYFMSFFTHHIVTTELLH